MIFIKSSVIQTYVASKRDIKRRQDELNAHYKAAQTESLLKANVERQKMLDARESLIGEYEKVLETLFTAIDVDRLVTENPANPNTRS